MRLRISLCLLLVAVATSLPLRAQSPENKVKIRGQSLDVYFFSAQGVRQQPHSKVLFVPGDGGWRGRAIKIAQTIASWGYDV